MNDRNHAPLGCGFTLFILIGTISLLLVIAHIAKKEAEADCAQHGAKPNYTSVYYNYICVTPDGRIVG